MILESFKFRGHSCFKTKWCGLDKFCPITVIIGRNNTGKSQLLDVVHRLLESTNLHEFPYPFLCDGILSDEQFLRGVFLENAAGGDLEGNHWVGHGRLLLGKSVRWVSDRDVRVEELDSPAKTSHVAEAYKKRIAGALAKAKNPMYRYRFRRLLADRDIAIETETDTLHLDAAGKGATNIIRQFIVSADYDEDLIQTGLRSALSEIFGTDGAFDRVEIRQLGKTAKDSDKKKWEVFLGETQKGLIPLSSSGSGLKTVILVLLNLLVVPRIEERNKNEYIFAFEELENNVHPALLRRLLKYLADYVAKERCFLFITTHSNVTLDFFSTNDDAQIIHVKHDGESASTRTIEGHFDQQALLSELGAKPSDLLQANGVVWVEGPSDRIYINRFVDLFSDGQLREGKDYQCAYYGGSNLANTTFSSPDSADPTFANLLRLNANVAVVCDGDRTAQSGKGSKIKGRVQRIKKEVAQIPNSYLWITDAKEIENYIPGQVWTTVYNKPITDPGKYDIFSAGNQSSFVARRLKRKTFDKCDFATRAAPHLAVENLTSRFELVERVTELVSQIRKWGE